MLAPRMHGYSGKLAVVQIIQYFGGWTGESCHRASDSKSLVFRKRVPAVQIRSSASHPQPTIRCSLYADNVKARVSYLCTGTDRLQGFRSLCHVGGLCGLLWLPLELVIGVGALVVAQQHSAQAAGQTRQCSTLHLLIGCGLVPEAWRPPTPRHTV